MREAITVVNLLVQTLRDHPWSSRMTERDARILERATKQLSDLAPWLVRIDSDFCKRIADLETENTRLKRESWEDGDRIQQLQKQLSDIRSPSNKE